MTRRAAPHPVLRPGLAAGLAALTGLAAACTEPEVFGIGVAASGQACAQLADCQAGLTCADGACAPLGGHSGPRLGDACEQDDDCGSDLVCGPQAACARDHGLALGAPCGLSEECLAGLVCHGASATCADPAGSPDGRGLRDLDQSCLGLTDCRRPYLCAIADTSAPTCRRLPFFPGPDCSASEEERGAFRVYWELPPHLLAAGDGDQASDGPAFEFYRQPFPSDLRWRVVPGATRASIDLHGHPRPGAVVGIDLAGQYLDGVERDADGFALNTTVFFQLTDFPRPSSLCLDAGGRYPAPADGESLALGWAGEDGRYCGGSDAPGAAGASVYLVDVDPASPEYGQHRPIELQLGPRRGQSICHNHLGLAPLPGQPLRPGTTYAAVLTRALRDIRGDAPLPDRDFARVLAGDPSLPDHVLAATAPLRAWLADRSPAAGSPLPETLAAATVFTTGQPALLGQVLYEAVLALPAPTFDANAFDCDSEPAGLPPPCHGRLLAGGAIARRACGSSPLVREIHGTYQAPRFQAGTRPYPTPAQGGALALVADPAAPGGLRPVVQGSETICYALAVPRGAPTPAGGWPVLIYSHGTGGDYRSHLTEGLLDEWVASGLAVIGIDNVMHGPRQDPASDPELWLADLWNLDDPGTLYFNVVNPAAARDNTLQGGADLIYLARLLAADQPAVAGLDLRFDATRLLFAGHSQGTTIVAPFLAHDALLAGALLSGAGAELPLSLLNKRQPVDIASVIGVLLGDRSLRRVHPMMGLIATLFGPTDLVAYAGRFVLAPPRRALPLVMVWGVGDQYTPDPTQAALVRALGVPLMTPVHLPVAGVPVVTGPLGDVSIDGQPAGVPAAALQYLPTQDEDGHFVLFRETDAAAAMTHFFDSTLAGSPEIAR